MMLDETVILRLHHLLEHRFSLESLGARLRRL
jgi:hypothetical protein